MPKKVKGMDEIYVNVFRREDGKQFIEMVHKEEGCIVYRQYISDDDVVFKKIFEVRSPRPYKLGQSCDGTIDCVVLSLYNEWCKARGLDAIKLLKQAYPNEDWNRDTFKYIIKLGHWEGYTQPKWDSDSDAEFNLLISLTEINYHSLVSVVSDYIGEA